MTKEELCNQGFFNAFVRELLRGGLYEDIEDVRMANKMHLSFLLGYQCGYDEGYADGRNDECEIEEDDCSD